MIQKADKLLLIAMCVGFVFHGTTLFFTFESTYDAYVHMFFADHYARSWFDPWDPRWYTGFNVISYPPLAHQCVALMSKIMNIKLAFGILAILIVQLYIVGIYRFSKLWTTRRGAGYAAIVGVFASSVVEALHLFGQLPTLMGIACLLNALPEVYRWIRYGKWYRLATALSIMAVGVSSHHVTTIFGMVFFVAPVMGLAVMDCIIPKLPNTPKGIDHTGTKSNILYQKLSNYFLKPKTVVLLLVEEIRIKLPRAIIFGACVPFLMGIIFPYFYWSKTDPITQVPIPHGSRDSFIEVTSSGLMFFLIPMGINLLLLPYVFNRVFSLRNMFIGLSFTLLVVLGTGGTTPIPLMMLGETAFNILTLDRFTFWASIICIPFVGEFFYRLLEGDFSYYIREKAGNWPHRLLWGFFAGAIGVLTILIVNLGNYRPLQPPTVDTTPIVNFLQRDQHDKWRFMTLGFGDQMAWLSAQTMAQSVDGNYHSARRLPEMTTRPLERLENSKFKGVQGLGSLQQFLTVPEKYYLKFIFSNDKFYDPILYFAGWERVQRLENGIMVWQKQDVPPLPSVLPRKEVPRIQRILWGILPVSTLIIAFAINFLFVWYNRFLNRTEYDDEYRSNLIELPSIKPALFAFMGVWIFILVAVTSAVVIKLWLRTPNDTPETIVQAYYDAIDFKYFRTAYEYFNPENRPSFDEYFIKLSVEDGIVASYAKLDNLRYEFETIDKNRVRAHVTAEWITPVQQYFTRNEHLLVKVDGKWYIQPPKFDPTIPPDNFIEGGVFAMHSQGKRKATTEPTSHDDIMDRPELKVLSARLIKRGDQFSVVGEIQNIDFTPAHVTIQSELYDIDNRKLVSFNAKYVAIHRIMPKEVVPFRIDFEETAWVKQDDLNPKKFDPDQFTAFNSDRHPVRFTVLARAVMDDKDLYRSIGVQKVAIENNRINGEVINHGTEEVSVPELLLSYYNYKGEVVWVESTFIREGVRPQRKRLFDVPFPDLSKTELVVEGKDEFFYVNGLPNSSFDSFGEKPVWNGRMKIPPAQGINALGIRVNGYIAEPTLY